MPGSFGGVSEPNRILCFGSTFANSTIRDCRHQPDSQYTFGRSIASWNGSKQ